MIIKPLSFLRFFYRVPAENTTTKVRIMSLAPKNLFQPINPFTWFTDFTGNSNSNSLINITNYKTNDVNVENTITTEVAGYGMQLGVIEEALEVVISLMKPQIDTASEEQKKAIHAFTTMVDKINEHKEKMVIDKFTHGGISDLVYNLETLKKDNPDLFAKVQEKLKKVI